MLINLIVNAAGHAGQRHAHAGTVDRDPGARCAALRITVRDTGGGIRAEDLARIFTLLHHQSAPGHRPGAVDQHTLVERYGGRIEVE